MAGQGFKYHVFLRRLSSRIGRRFRVLGFGLGEPLACSVLLLSWRRIVENEVFCPGHQVVIGGAVPRGWGHSRRVVRTWREAEPGELGTFCPQSSFLKQRLFGVCFAGRSARGPCSGDTVEEPGSASSRLVPRWLWAQRANNSSFSSLFSFSHVRACSPANVKSLLFTYRSTKLQRMGLGDKFSILRHADGSSIFTQNQQQNRNATGKNKKTHKKKPTHKKKKKKDFV